jgi:sigma-B regulation protein RsbU (phosphoserine phosphatase)
MSTPIDEYLRGELVDRRARLERAVRHAPASSDYRALLAEVDAALARVETGTYGRCEACGDAIEPHRLLADPLVRRCLDHLSPAEQRRLEQDLELAARIQAALLPPHEMSAAGWEIAYHFEPVGHVGGDYCDVILREAGDGLLFLFGDVSGKGVAASILMSNLHATFRSLAPAGLRIEHLMARANRVFCGSTTTDHYATLVGGHLTASGEGWIVNAGHWPPWVIRRGRLEQLDAGGLALGMFCDSTYEAQAVQLDAGDLLVLYTDGVTEAHDGRGREYGADRLAALIADLAREAPLAAPSLVAACVNDLAAFRAGTSATDDVTLMVVRRAA